jgi:hypothetical protein
MYLTEKSRGRQRDVDQHDEVELLLEAYVKQVDGIVQEADQLASNMRNTEEIVNIILDANRNSLMLLDLKVLTLSLHLYIPLLQHILTIGLNDDIGNRFWRRNSRLARHESEELHGRLGLWIPGHHVNGFRDEYVGLRIWSCTTETDPKVDVIWTISRDSEKEGFD